MSTLEIPAPAGAASGRRFELWRNLALLRLRQLAALPAMLRHHRAETARRRADPANLMNFERRVFSQNGEDGILAEIFRRLGAGGRSFVEFGIEDGRQNCTRRLLEEEGWTGLWMEGSAAYVASARGRFAGLPVRVEPARVDAENVEELFARFGVPAEPDLLVIDIDGNDWWVWRALQRFRPRVVVVEYNASHPPGDDWVLPYDPAHCWDYTLRYGASLDAYARLGAEKGYALVGCDAHGVNAFFVRRDLLGGAFTRADAGAAYHYVHPKALFFDRVSRLLGAPAGGAGR
jgi:methyltransferase FkbM-like protein